MAYKNTYDDRTINSPDFFARYAHRNRLKKCLKKVVPRLDLGKVLDYGCGTGVFLSELLKIKPDCVIGYEAFSANFIFLYGKIYRQDDTK